MANEWKLEKRKYINFNMRLLLVILYLSYSLIEKDKKFINLELNNYEK